MTRHTSKRILNVLSKISIAMPKHIVNCEHGQNVDICATHWAFIVDGTPCNMSVSSSFDTSFGGFTYEDQFLQISTTLPTSYLYGFGEHNHRQFQHNMNWKTWAMFTRDVAPIVSWVFILFRGLIQKFKNVYTTVFEIFAIFWSLLRNLEIKYIYVFDNHIHHYFKELIVT